MLSTHIRSLQMIPTVPIHLDVPRIQLTCWMIGHHSMHTQGQVYFCAQYSVYTHCIVTLCYIADWHYVKLYITKMDGLKSTNKIDTPNRSIFPGVSVKY